MWEKVEMHDLKETEVAMALAECVGMETFKRIVQDFGGSLIYIPTEKKILRGARDREIISEFEKGLSRNQIARKYHISSSRVRAIINENNDRKV